MVRLCCRRRRYEAVAEDGLITVHRHLYRSGGGSEAAAREGLLISSEEIGLLGSESMELHNSNWANLSRGLQEESAHLMLLQAPSAPHAPRYWKELSCLQPLRQGKTLAADVFRESAHVAVLAQLEGTD